MICQNYVDGKPDGNVFGMKGVVTPTGVTLLAGGALFVITIMDVFQLLFVLNATAGSDTYGISQPPYLKKSVPVTKFVWTGFIAGSTFNYSEVMTFSIDVKSIEHTNKNELTPKK